jgi:hypothetical protein
LSGTFTAIQFEIELAAGSGSWKLRLGGAGSWKLVADIEVWKLTSKP